MRTPAVDQFFSCYMHEDWPVLYDTPLDAAADFAQTNPDLAPLLPAEVAEILRTTQGRRAILALMERSYANYLPNRDGFTYRGWLEAVSDRVMRTLAGEPGSSPKAPGPDRGRPQHWHTPEHDDYVNSRVRRAYQEGSKPTATVIYDIDDADVLPVGTGPGDLAGIERFVRGYLHRGDDARDGSVPAALAAYVREEPDLAAGLVREVRVLLPALPDYEIDDTISAWRPEYWPTHLNLSWHEWLQGVADQVAALLADGSDANPVME